MLLVAGLALAPTAALVWQSGVLGNGTVGAQAASDSPDCRACDHAPGAGQAGCDEHDEHDHQEHKGPEQPVGQAGCDKHAGPNEHDEHDHAEDRPAGPGHEGHGHEEALEPVRLTVEQMRRFGIELAVAGPGEIRRRILLPGEVRVNEDRAAHIVPPAGGVVRKVTAKVGDTVRGGDVLAMLDSAELGEAKTAHLAKRNELSCCGTDLARAEAIRQATVGLLDLLDRSPSLDELRTAKLGEVGEGHGKLVSAYAELAFTTAAYERERKLLEEQVSSRGDFQTAEAAYKKAYAEYVAIRGTIDYETRRALLEAQRSRRNTEMEATAAERKLHILGLTEHEVEHLAEGGPDGGSKPCADPNCPGCRAGTAGAHGAAAHAPDRAIGVYWLRAPFDGTVVQKHIAVGEKLSDDADVFLIADLSEVWVDLSVHQKDLPFIRKGQAVRISAGGGVPDAAGEISFVSPVIDETTRTCLARIVLPNPHGAHRPGLFITAEVEVGRLDVAVLLPKDAVQRIEDEPVVFVPAAEGLAPRHVRTGRESRTHVEVVSGLAAGERYVAKGAFELKAQIVTGGLGAHAGHGH